MSAAPTRSPDHEDNSGPGPNQVQRFRDLLVADQRKGNERVKKGEKRQRPELSAQAAFNLLMLASPALARTDGSLRGRREGRDGWWDEQQLARFLGVRDKTFREWWQAWEAAGWVRSETPDDYGRRRRWLVAERTRSK